MPDKPFTPNWRSLGPDEEGFATMVEAFAAMVEAAFPVHYSLGKAGGVAGAVCLLRSRRHSACVQKPSKSGKPRMLHGGRVQLLQRNAWHRLRVMLDAQVLVDLCCIADVVHSIRFRGRRLGRLRRSSSSLSSCDSLAVAPASASLYSASSPA